MAALLTVLAFGVLVLLTPLPVEHVGAPTNPRRWLWAASFAGLVSCGPLGLGLVLTPGAAWFHGWVPIVVATVCWIVYWVSLRRPRLGSVHWGLHLLGILGWHLLGGLAFLVSGSLT